MEVNEVGKTVQKNLASFLAGKPMWMYWIAYSAVLGLLFGVFYMAMYLMVLQWWVPIMIVVAIGIMWGTFAYSNILLDTKKKS